MTAAWFESPQWMALLFALLHTLWQGALAASLLCVALRVIPARRANLRYALSTGALVIVVLAAFETWAALDIRARSTVEHIPARQAVLPIDQQTRSQPRVNPAANAPVTAPATRLSQASPSPAPSRWPLWIGAFWLCGVVICLARAVRGVIGADRLRRRCRVIMDPRILAMAEELRARLHLPRQVRLMFSDEIGVPCVMGIIWPVVLLPAALLTGIPPEQLRAILAHEMAHIRRWDYLVNLGQMVIEAFLFFNPFVWWISRQMRLEREACCDHVAAAECQSSARYIEALLSVLERSRSAPEAAMAASGDDTGGALDRARRLLVPGYLPALRLRWFSMALVLLIAGVAMFGLWAGSRAVAQSVTPPARKQVGPPFNRDSVPWTETWTMSGRGTVSTADGRPIDLKSVKVTAYSILPSAPNSSMASAANATFQQVPNNGEFFVQFPRPVSVSIAATMDGYAPTFVGPFRTITGRWNRDGAQGAYPATFIDASGFPMPRVHITLFRGLSAAIQAVNEAGQPIPDATIKGQYPGPPPLDFPETKTGSDGRVLLQHIAAAPLNLSISAIGYQADAITAIHLDPANPYRWKLKAAQPVQGIVTSAITGNPIPGASIKLAGIQGQQSQVNSDPGSAPLLATTDARGHFTLNSLRADSRYYLYVDAPKHAGELVSGITPSSPEIKVALGPEMVVRGRLIHAFPAPEWEGNYHLDYEQFFKIGDTYNATGHDMVVRPINGEADFVTGPVYNSPVTFQPGGKDITVAPADFSKPGLVLDLAPRAIVLPKATGTDSSQRSNADSTPATPQAGSPADKGFASFKIQVSTADGPARPPAMAYWHSNSGSVDTYQAAHMEDDGSFPVSVTSNARSFSLAIAKPGYAVLFAGPFTPPIAASLDALHLQLSSGFTGSIRVVDESGQPVAGAKLNSYYPGPPAVYMPEVTTDGSGVAVIDHIGDAPLNIRIRAEGYQADEIAGIPLNAATPYRWTLLQAQPLPGIVTSASTGQPIAGAKIKLAGVRGPHKENYFDPASAPLLATTDAAGHFALTTLRTDSRYFLYIEAPGHAGVMLSEIKAGQGELNVALGPELFVRGKVIHIDHKAFSYGKIRLYYNQFFQMENEGGSTQKDITLQPKNGEADFVAGPLYDLPVEMEVHDSKIKIEAKDLPKSGIIIDLAPALAQK